MISLVMATYNRADTLPRAIESVLRQEYTDWELIIVDDGSTDTTGEVLARYSDPRIRVLRHARNRGVNAAKNTGFDQMRGEWFTTFDSDDEMYPYALSSFVAEIDRHNPPLDSISCNCVDSVTGKFTGIGMSRDQYFDVKTVVTQCSGEFWGLIRRSLLGQHRLNEKMFDMESVLWAKIHDGARIYYINRALKIYHTEGVDRVTSAQPVNPRRKQWLYDTYVALLDEERGYLDKLEAWNPAGYSDLMFQAAVQCIAFGDRRRAWRILVTQRRRLRLEHQLVAASGVVLGPEWVTLLKRLRHAARGR